MKKASGRAAEGECPMLLLRVAWKLVALGRQAICASSWIVSGQLGSDSRAEDGIDVLFP
jgi:hypothetical protein